MNADPLALLAPRRQIDGCSAVLLPFARGAIDWEGFSAHLERTIESGLRPAVNMDTGHVHLLSDAERTHVLDVCQESGAPAWLAGAAVDDQPGDAFDHESHARACEAVAGRGGIPVVFPSHGLASLDEDAWVAAHQKLADSVDAFVGFELGTMFHPAGRIVSLDAYRGLMEIATCVGAKHSSLDRRQEWERLALRNKVRPDFRVYTGNDLAIDMVMYGSDYLLGLSTFAPDAFARRDALWAQGDPDFYELNDLLQYLGEVAFRAPVPGYRHSAAQFLQVRGWLRTAEAAPGEPARPDADVELLRDIASRLESAMARPA
jgi:dihydrodipicolinate synthase/N-acetylneuraminate lyase